MRYTDFRLGDLRGWLVHRIRALRQSLVAEGDLEWLTWLLHHPCLRSSHDSVCWRR